MPTKQTVTIKSNEENPEPIELIAQGVIDVADAFKRIEDGRLRKRAIILLIKDKCSSHIGLRDIEEILTIVPQLKDFYVKQLAKKT